MKNWKSLRECGAIIKWGIASRMYLLLFQVFSNNLIPDHIGSMEDVFTRGYRDPPHHPLVEAALGGFDNWDSEHFIFIAEHGYGVHEKTMAFFPLFPFLISILSHTLFGPLLLFLSPRSVLLVAGFTINLMTFPLAALSLYMLTLQLFKDRQFSLLTIVLFCINPASVFMSALYTECLFSFLTFLGLLALERGYSWSATVLFTLATATRANGIVLSGYIGYQCLLILYKRLNTNSCPLSLIESCLLTLNTALQCVLIASPLVLFQYHGYQLYCTASDQPVWCMWALPFPYSYIQDHYWNNGFLRYFQLKQIPNFFLAAPMIILCSCYIVRYFTANKEKVKSTQDKVLILLQSDRMRPYAFYLVFLVLFGTFVMNVQVITRFICSASPLVYWFSASVLLPSLTPRTDLKQAELSKVAGWAVRTVFSQSGLTASKLVLGYFLLYVFLGFILHCNFYPWT